VRSIEGSICSATIADQEVHFFVANPRDEIQRHHAQGRFYETEELEIVEQFFPIGGVFVDIGANVGNHAIYAGKYLHPTQIVAIEPNPVAVELLKINVALNGLQSLVDLSHIGTGFADVPCWAHALIPYDNLGGARMNIVEGTEGLKLIPGDDILLQRRVDFIKLDVEGMEMLVLTGLAGTIAKWRPPMFIEIETDNADAFQEWIDAQAYVTVYKTRRYSTSENYIVVPNEALASILKRLGVDYP
jgi:FkbM family methyltransferase